MDDSKQLSFVIKDKVFGENLSPSNITLPLLKDFTNQVMTFLRGSTRPDLGVVKAKIIEGSLAVATIDTTDILSEAYEDYQVIKSEGDLGSIDPARARVVELWQDEAKKGANRIYELFSGATTAASAKVVISSETDFKVKAELWVDVELYIYGKIFDLGGKNKPNVHIELENGTSIKVGAEQSVLFKDDENRLYKDQLVRITAKRNIKTGRIKDEQLISFERYDPEFREDEYEQIARKAMVAWRSVKDVTRWVEDLRGHSV